MLKQEHIRHEDTRGSLTWQFKHKPDAQPYTSRLAQKDGGRREIVYEILYLTLRKYNLIWKVELKVKLRINRKKIFKNSISAFCIYFDVCMYPIQTILLSQVEKLIGIRQSSLFFNIWKKNMNLMKKLSEAFLYGGKHENHLSKFKYSSP